jgi:hypothetical protein
MNKLYIPLVLVLLVIVFASGCSTMETDQERYWRLAQVWQIDNRLMIDDFDYMLLINRNSSLSKYHQRMGY